MIFIRMESRKKIYTRLIACATDPLVTTSTEPLPSSTPEKTAPITTPKMPRVLARLQPHNPLGIKEDPPGTTTRGSRYRLN